MKGGKLLKWSDSSKLDDGWLSLTLYSQQYVTVRIESRSQTKGEEKRKKGKKKVSGDSYSIPATRLR